MTLFKTTFFTIVAILGCTHIAVAGPASLSKKDVPKITVFGHTGQDPVYKSTIGKPNSKWDMPTLDPSSLSDLSTISLIELDVLNKKEDWIASQTNSTSSLSTEFTLPQLDAISAARVDDRSKGIGGGGTVPAPSAIPLLLIGLASSVKRRRA